MLRARPWLLLLALAAFACSRTRGNDEVYPADAAALRCVEACDDGLFCNGVESCDPDAGVCVAGEAQPCDDDDECTIEDVLVRQTLSALCDSGCGGARQCTPSNPPSLNSSFRSQHGAQLPSAPS